MYGLKYWMRVNFSGLNLIGRQRDLLNHTYQPASYTAMECDPSPSRHTHRQQRYQATAPLMSFGHSSLPYTPYTGHPVSDNTPQKQTSAQNGPQNKDRDDSPMVGVCVQQSPVAIHWNIIVRCVVMYVYVEILYEVIRNCLRNRLRAK